MRSIFVAVVGAAAVAPCLAFSPICVGCTQVPAAASARASGVDAAYDGDPIDLSTGLYQRVDDDLSVPGTPIVLTRSYRTRDDHSRPFGVGANHPYNMYLIGDGDTFQWAELILEDGGRIRFEPVSSGKTHFDAIFEHKASPTEFYGALLQWNGQGWNIDLRDGGRYLFGACTPHGKDVCHIVGHRDAHGVETVLQHDAAGDLTRISSGDGWIALSYDTSHHITFARSSRGETVKYDYDDGGHLVRAAHSDGRLQEYTYGAHHEMRSIREPDREIVNFYDDKVWCVKQVITFGARGEPPRDNPDVYRFSYRTGADGKTAETRVVQPSGTVRVATFNRNGYLVTDTTDEGGPGFTQVIYARDDRTNLADRVTVRCAKRGQLVEAFGIVGPFEHPDTVRGRVIAENCR